MDQITTLAPWFFGLSLLVGACVEGAKEIAQKLSLRAFPRSFALALGALWALPPLSQYGAPEDLFARVSLGVLAGSQSALVYWLGARLFAQKLQAALPAQSPATKAPHEVEGSNNADPGGLT